MGPDGGIEMSKFYRTRKVIRSTGQIRAHLPAS